MEKVIDTEEKEVDPDDDDDDDDNDDDDDVTTTTPSTKDDIHFVEEDESEVTIEQEKAKPRRPVTSSKKDDLLYEYYSEYMDEDYDDLSSNTVSDRKLPPMVAPIPKNDAPVVKSVEPDTTTTTETEKSVIFPPSYIFLIIASALVSFTVFMLAFLVCRRTVAQRRQKKLMPFVVSPSSYASPTLSTSIKSSGPIVKNYQRVPTSTKEFLYQQQQQQLDQSQGETKEPLLT